MAWSNPPGTLPMDAKPPHSKSAPYYAIHPLWTDVVPIPQPDQTGTLAAIRYWPRYSEAMSYLRALMADNEVSERALALTEDLISMNPAHYTVWIYRMNVLKGLWTGDRVSKPDLAAEKLQPEPKLGSERPQNDDNNAVDGAGCGSNGSDIESDAERLWKNVKNEIRWLDEVSFKNLKNYQIWHHRHALIDLLPEDPAGKPFDTMPPPIPMPTATPMPSKQPATTSTSEPTWGFENRLPDPAPKPTSKAASTKAVLDKAMIQKVADLIKSEQTFLAQILSLDTKNYHVWSYRQWLCTRYPSFLLPSYSYTLSSTPAQPSPQSHTPLQPPKSIASLYRSHAEVHAIDTLIADDLRNNSAWSHRYFLLFGHHELHFSLIHNVVLKTVNEKRLLDAEGLLDTKLVDAEIAYTQTEIRRAPMNGSSWNYLRGVLGHGGRDIRSVKVFCEEFLGPEGDLWMDQYVDVRTSSGTTDDGGEVVERQEVGVRSARAVEWLSEIYAREGTEEGRVRARECLKSLAEKWDVIRQGYWEYLGENMEKEWAEQKEG